MAPKGNITTLFIRALMAALVLVFLSGCAINVDNPGICTNDIGMIANDASFLDQLQINGKGPIEAVVSNIAFQVKDTIQKVFEALRTSVLREVVVQVLILYFVLYGAMVAMGMVQLTMGDAVVRLCKVAVVAMVMSDDGFQIYYSMMGGIFIEGADQLINSITAQFADFTDGGALGASSSAMADALAKYTREYDNSNQVVSGEPLAVLDVLLAKLFSSRSIRFYLALLINIPMGIVYLGFLAMAILALLGAIGHAIWIYLMSLIAKAFLLAMGPLFLIMILFKQTFQFFDAWIKQLIAFTLQPIVLFCFLAMFSILIDIALNTAFGVDGNRIGVCLQPINFPLLQSYGITVYAWQFPQGTEAIPIFDGTGMTGGVLAPREQQFPLRIDDVFVFWALAWIMWKFQPHILDMTMELAQMYIRLDEMRSYNEAANLPDMMKGARGKVGKAAGTLALNGAGRMAKGIGRRLIS